MSGIKLISLFLFVVVIVGCTDNTAKLPDGYLTKGEMIPLMVDIHLIEGARSGKMVLGDTNSIPDYYARIYLKHDVSEKTFKESFDWYTGHPKELKEIYTEVIEDLSIIDAELKSSKKGEPKTKKE